MPNARQNEHLTELPAQADQPGERAALLQAADGQAKSAGGGVAGEAGGRREAAAGPGRGEDSAEERELGRGHAEHGALGGAQLAALPGLEEGPPSGGEKRR